MLFELRQYRVQPGQRENWVKFADEVMIPFQTAKGMTIIGSWIGEEDEDLFVWLRRFDSEEDRARLYEAVYESEEWKTSLGPKAIEMLVRGKSIITRMIPTPRSNTR
jgi:NIPSNAP